LKRSNSIWHKMRRDRGLLVGLCYGFLYGFVELMVFMIDFLYPHGIISDISFYYIITDSWILLIVTLFVENVVVALISCVFVHFVIGFIIGKQIHKISEKSLHIKIFLYSWISYIVVFPVIRTFGFILTVLVQTIIDPGGWWA
jgi:hypothetical protein